MTLTDDVNSSATTDNFIHVYEGQAANGATVPRLSLISANHQISQAVSVTKLGAVAADIDAGTAGLEFAAIRVDGFIETYTAAGNRIHVFRNSGASPISIDTFGNQLVTMEGTRLDLFTFDGVNQPTFVGDVTLGTTSTLVDTIVIPEPGSFAGISAGLALLLVRRRRCV